MCLLKQLFDILWFFFFPALSGKQNKKKKKIKHLPEVPASTGKVSETRIPCLCGPRFYSSTVPGGGRRGSWWETKLSPVFGQAQQDWEHRMAGGWSILRCAAPSRRFWALILVFTLVIDSLPVATGLPEHAYSV